MLGLMRDWPLLVPRLLDHAATVHGSREIVSRRHDGRLHRSSWLNLQARAKKLSHALTRAGIRNGDRVATLAWNTDQHLECLYGIVGAGGVAHTINPRLFPEQIAYIANHAQDRILFFDPSFADLVSDLAPKLDTIERYVMLDTPLKAARIERLAVEHHDSFVASGDEDFEWRELDEAEACGLCYTSGTTGNPKGVLYSHRSTVLHSIAAQAPDALGLSSASCALPIVPMYHVNAWGLPYAAAAAGAKLVLAGAMLDPPTLQALIVDEGVTLAAAVPTVWLGMLQHLDEAGLGLGCLKRVMIGGSAAPRSVIEALEQQHGVVVAHAWGMTETSPLGTVAAPGADVGGLSRSQRTDLQCKQGRPLFGVQMDIVNDGGTSLPRDGVVAGHLIVRGPWIADGYYREASPPDPIRLGWFETGDIATIDEHGYMRITDRAKDVIKSGGEWISSIELENAAVGFPGVAEAAVIGIPHPKWDERPLLIVVTKPGVVVTTPDVLSYLSGRVAKWWLPEQVVFVDELPHTATGKILKTELRDRFADFRG